MADIKERCQELATLLVDPLRQRARELGYALLLHGSLARDIDMVAVPWARNAVPPRELACAIRDLAASLNAGLAIESDRIGAANPDYFDNGFPGLKPHGRLCWTYHLGGGPYLDLSVMPITGNDSDE